MRKAATWLPALVLLMGCAFIWHTKGQVAMALARPLSGVLDTIPGYRHEEQRVSAEERRIAGMTDYVARIYRRDSIVAFTTLVSYYDRQTQGKTIHSPKNCLPGAGWEVLRGSTTKVVANGTAYDVNRFVLKNGAAVAVAYYWYQGRGRVVASEYRVKWNLLHDAAVLGHTEEALVRIVVPVRAGQGGVNLNSDRSFAAANALGTEIAALLITDVTKVLPAASQSAMRPSRQALAAR